MPGMISTGTRIVRSGSENHHNQNRSRDHDYPTSSNNHPPG